MEKNNIFANQLKGKNGRYQHSITENKIKVVHKSHKKITNFKYLLRRKQNFPQNVSEKNMNLVKESHENSRIS